MSIQKKSLWAHQGFILSLGCVLCHDLAYKKKKKEWVGAQSPVCLAIHQHNGGQGSHTILARGKSESCDKGSDNWRELSGWSNGECVQKSCHLDMSVHMCQEARPPMGWHTLKPVMRLMWVEMALALRPCGFRALTYQSSLNVKANVQLLLTPDVKLRPTSHEYFHCSYTGYKV